MGLRQRTPGLLLIYFFIIIIINCRTLSVLRHVFCMQRGGGCGNLGAEEVKMQLSKLCKGGGGAKGDGRLEGGVRLRPQPANGAGLGGIDGRKQMG